MHAAEPRSRLLIFGVGYIGEHVARAATGHNFAVTGTTRSRDGARRLHETLGGGNIQTVVFSGREPLPDELIDEELASVTHVLSTVPPSMGFDPVLQHCAHVLETRMPALQWIGHVSSASVYGTQADIDQSTEPRPSEVAERLRILIESEWAAIGSSAAAPVHIFRPTSVYGPWRGPQQLLRERRATLIEKEEHITSRVHVVDVARAIVASMEQAPSSPAATGAATDATHGDGSHGLHTYALSDGHPASPSEVLEYAARVFEQPSPERVPYAAIEPTLSTASRTFWARPIRATAAGFVALGLQPIYPSYMQGLDAIREIEGPLPPPAEAAPPPPTPSVDARAASDPTPPRRQLRAPGTDPMDLWQLLDGELILRRQHATVTEASSLLSQLASRPGYQADWPVPQLRLQDTDVTVSLPVSGGPLTSAEVAAMRALAALVTSATKAPRGAQPKAARRSSSPTIAVATQGLTAEQVDGLKVAELKEELRARGLPVSGLKQVLADRLKDALAVAE